MSTGELLYMQQKDVFAKRHHLNVPICMNLCTARVYSLNQQCVCVNVCMHECVEGWWVGGDFNSFLNSTTYIMAKFHGKEVLLHSWWSNDMEKLSALLPFVRGIHDTSGFQCRAFMFPLLVKKTIA